MKWPRPKVVVVFFAVASAVAATVACSDSESSPPLAELTMRDALGADPAVVHGLPDGEKGSLADKFKAALESQSAIEEAESTGIITAADEVRAIDDERAARDLDAMLAADVTVSNGRLVAHPHAYSEALDAGPSAATALPPIEGDTPTVTNDEETRALAGAAGRVIQKMLAETHARRVMRVTGWPMATVAIDDVVYVNASWLVAMSAREPTSNAAPAINQVPGVVSFITPQSLRGNPYHLYDTLNACVGDVSSRCETCVNGGACDDHATLTDFPDGKSECTYLVGGGEKPVYSGGPLIFTRVEELCALSLLDVCTVATCVSKESCTLPVSISVSTAGNVQISTSILGTADAFVADDGCVRALDLCLSGTPFGLDAGFDLSLNIKVEGCDNPLQACGSSFNACTNTCSSGRCSGGGSGPSCSSCSSCTSCSGFGSDTRTSAGSGSGYGSVGYQASGNTNGSTSGTGGCGGCGGSGSGGGEVNVGTGIGNGPPSGPPKSARPVDRTHVNDLDIDGGEEGGAGAPGAGRQVDKTHQVDTKSREGDLSGGDNQSGDPNAESETPGGGAGNNGNAGACATVDNGHGKKLPGEPPFAPATTIFWLLLPIAYLAARSRRVS